MPESNEQVPGLGGFRVEVSTVRQRLNQRAEANRMAASDRQQREQSDRRPVRVLGREAGSGLVRVQLADGSVRLISEAEAQKAGLLRTAPPPAAAGALKPVPARARRPQNVNFGVGLNRGQRLCFLYVWFNGPVAELWQQDALADSWTSLGEIGRYRQFRHVVPNDPTLLYRGDSVLLYEPDEEPLDYWLSSEGNSPDLTSTDFSDFSLYLNLLVYVPPLPFDEVVSEAQDPTFWRLATNPTLYSRVEPFLTPATPLRSWSAGCSNLVIIPWVGGTGRGVDCYRLQPAEAQVDISGIFGNIFFGDYASWPSQGIFPIYNRKIYFQCQGTGNPDLLTGQRGIFKLYETGKAAMGVTIESISAELALRNLPTFTTLYQSTPDTRIVVAGDGDAVPSSRTALLADRTLPVCNHRGRVFTAQGPQGLVVFDSKGQQFAPSNVCELAEAEAAGAPRRWAQGPYYRLNGADVVAENRRKMQLKVVDDTGLPDALVTAINQRNRDDGDWYQFGRPEWEMGTFWPCAAVFW